MPSQQNKQGVGAMQKKGRGVIFENDTKAPSQGRRHTWLDVAAVAAAGMAGVYVLALATYRALLWAIGL